MKIIPNSQKNRYIARVVIVLAAIALIVWLVSWLSAPSSEIGDWSEIRTWYDLDAVRDNLAGNYTLMNDLDSNSAGYTELASPTANGGNGWEPIESSVIPSEGDCGVIPARGVEVTVYPVPVIGLKGTFDGQGYEIRDLCINRPGGSYVGLFGSVDGGGIIKNVGVVNVTVTGSNHVGVLAGRNFYSGTVSNSYSTGSVTGDEDVGGLVGWNYGTMSNSYSTSNVTGNCYVGGLIGRNKRGSIISNSFYNYDEVLINGEKIITIGALFDENFDEWLANDKFLDINDKLSQENGYYVVNNVADFKELLAFGQNDSLKFSLKDDIDLGDDPNFYIPYFAGEFDGNGHKISNLSFDFDFVSPVGLFGCLASGEKVTDLGVENVNVTGAGFVGGLAGINLACTVSNSYVTGSVSGNSGIELYEGVGGLVGENWGDVSNSYFRGNVNGENYVGGLLGKNIGDVSNSYSTGSVTGTRRIVGGLVGVDYGSTVSNSYSTASVTGDRYVGGLVGWSGQFSTVSNSYASGSVTGNELVGGLVGRNGGTVSNSYASGSVTGDEEVGGLVGWHWGTVSNCYAKGTVTRSSGENTDFGGFVGTNSQGKIINCYSTGSIHYEGAADPTDKGFAGRVYRGKMTGNFWDTQTSDQTSTAGGTGKTTAQMKNIATFSGATWDIIGVANPSIRNTSYIWNIVDDETYPFLSWQS